MSKSNISTNLYSACEDYINTVGLLLSANIFSLNNKKLLSKMVKTYITFYEANKSKTEHLILIEDHELNLIESIHKLYPVKYFNKEHVRTKWLVNACIYQRAYLNSISGLLNNFKAKKWIKSYLSFLKKHKKNIFLRNIPTIEQDFVWRAHMQNNTSYMSDIIRYTKNLMNYDNYDLRDKLYSHNDPWNDINAGSKFNKSRKKKIIVNKLK